MTSRRSFLKQSAAGAAVGITRTSTVPADSRKDRMPVAVVGCGGMGAEHLTRLTQRDDVEVRYVCDVDALRLASAAKTVEAAGKAPQAVKDFRRILDDRDVVAVWHATPDHWHTPGAILTADAGKHVYVEKPCSHNVREGRLLVEAGQRNNVVIQVGTQSRSTRTVVEAMQRIHDGMIGDIIVAKAWNSQLRDNLGHVRPSPPPAELDFELWQGPAPEAPFYSNRIPYAWRFFFSYGVGDMGNDGVHNVDVAAWGLQLDRLPDRVAAFGGKYFFDDDQEWPDTHYVICEIDGTDSNSRPRQLIYEQRIWTDYGQEGYEHGNAFYGTKGVLLLGHTRGWKLFGPKNVLIEQMTGKVDLVAHHTNFLDAIRGRATAAAPAISGHVSAGICHLANIATRLRRAVHFDPVREVVVGDDEAQAMTKRTYRDGHWAIPQNA